MHKVSVRQIWPNMNNFAGYDYWVVENVKKDYFYFNVLKVFVVELFKFRKDPEN